MMINQMQFWSNAHILVIPLYLFIGHFVIFNINSNGESIFVMLSEVGVGAKGQGVAYLILTISWPIWAFIAMQATFQNYFSEGVEE